MKRLYNWTWLKISKDTDSTILRPWYFDHLFTGFIQIMLNLDGTESESFRFTIYPKFRRNKPVRHGYELRLFTRKLSSQVILDN